MLTFDIDDSAFISTSLFGILALKCLSLPYSLSLMILHRTSLLKVGYSLFSTIRWCNNFLDKDKEMMNPGHERRLECKVDAQYATCIFGWTVELQLNSFDCIILPGTVRFFFYLLRCYNNRINVMIIREPSTKRK